MSTNTESELEKAYDAYCDSPLYMENQHRSFTEGWKAHTRIYNERERANMTQDAHERYYYHKDSNSSVMLGWVLLGGAVTALIALAVWFFPWIIAGIRSYL